MTEEQSATTEISTGRSIKLGTVSEGRYHLSWVLRLWLSYLKPRGRKCTWPGEQCKTRHQGVAGPGVTEPLNMVEFGCSAECDGKERCAERRRFVDPQRIS